MTAKGHKMSTRRHKMATKAKRQNYQDTRNDYRVKETNPCFCLLFVVFRCKETQKTMNRHKVITESRADKKQPCVLIPLSPADSGVGDILGQSVVDELLQM